MAEPLVSVVISTYNRAELLKTRSLPSVLAQTHQNLDIHVVGDGTDTETVVFMQNHPDPRVRFTNLPRQEYPTDPGTKWCVIGLEARNYGHETAKGQYIANLDDDDEWLPTTVEQLLRHLIADDADVAYGKSKAFGADGSIAWYGNWPPMHFAFCDGAWLSRHDLGFRYDKDCVKRGLPEDGDRIDRMVAAGLKFTMINDIVHYYYPNPR
jgi:glycosyltransferase involved in cell wall biosynthesis